MKRTIPAIGVIIILMLTSMPSITAETTQSRTIYVYDDNTDGSWAGISQDIYSLIEPNRMNDDNLEVFVEPPIILIGMATQVKITVFLNEEPYEDAWVNLFSMDVNLSDSTLSDGSIKFFVSPSSTGNISISVNNITTNTVIEVTSKITFVDDDFNESTPGWDHNHFDKIQDGIDAASEYTSVYVYNGIYHENIVIHKSITLFGEYKKAIIDGGGTGDVISILSDWVRISGFIIQNSGDQFTNAGLSIQSDEIVISRNIIKDNNRVGILLCDSSFNTIKNNEIFNNLKHGIHLSYNASKNNISNNIISYNRDCGLNLSVECNENEIFNNKIMMSVNDGVCLFSNTHNNTISNNVIIDNERVGINGIDSDSWGFYGQSYNNILKDNYISKNSKGICMEGLNINKSSNVISGNFIFSNDYSGLELRWHSYNKISSNTISNNENGITLYHSEENNISENYISSNKKQGIFIQGFNSYVFTFGDKNIILNNQIINNFNGIDLNHSNLNYITNNNIEFNTQSGIQLYNSNDNNLSSNIITSNQYEGITLDNNSNDNIITDNYLALNNYGIVLNQSESDISMNSIYKNDEYGIYLVNSTSNIKNNDFFDNNKNAFFTNSNNYWKGNYWDRPRFLPYIIFGFFSDKLRIQCDWHPAHKTYDIN